MARRTGRAGEATPLTGHLGYWLRFVSNHVSHAFARKLERRGVTVAEWVVLRELFERDGVPPSDIAARTGLTRGAISKLTARLAAKALAGEAPGKGDRRFLVLRLTPAGRALVPALAALADENDAEFFGHLGARERGAIVRAMQDIVRRRGLKTVPTE
ncbi:MAG TPA: MarR family transcriptional regulator [Rhizomicrobium sp.]|nr:MarR family transcriptional regulator [Rhizomicrobium sp.]